MAAFIDATCTQCKGKVSWMGEMKDRPACPRCGHVPQKESDELEAELDRREAELEAEMLKDD